ncbi:MAG: GTP 3',8-cyclase MoaA [Oscillospiraceae bacterium]|nr:GTP 3',8-cyclase MoaA [Oscillospiraceae bacterium]
MIDNFGRNIDYIRISVTDRCNLRCVYCMPEEGVESVAHNAIITFDEILRICRVLAKNGLKKVKITGGEPLVRRGVANLIKQIKDIDGIESVTITTNGVLLTEQYHNLVGAGVDSITVSLDTLDREKYAKLTRRDEIGRVLKGIALAQKEGQTRLKINSVPAYGLDEQEIISLIQFAKDYDTDVRFIEVMPIGSGSDFETVTEDDIKKVIEKHYGKLTLYSEKRGNGPSVHYSIDGFKGKIGFISAVSHKFCDKCNRVRLTADGHLKACLQFEAGVDLMPTLRGNKNDSELLQVLMDGIANKPQSHRFDDKDYFKDKENRTMSQIGG